MLPVIGGLIRRGKTRLVETHDPVWRSARGVGAFKSQGGQGLRGSSEGLGEGECRRICGVRGLGFLFGKIECSKVIVLRIGLRDIWSPN